MDSYGGEKYPFMALSFYVMVTLSNSNREGDRHDYARGLGYD